MKIDKKKLIYIAVALAIVTAALIATVFIFKAFQKTDNIQVTPVATVEQADALKAQAQVAAKANETAHAKQLLLEARQIYVNINNLDGIAGTDAQLYLIAHPR